MGGEVKVTVSNRAVLRFGHDMGVTTISVPRANVALNAAAVRAAMDAMLASGALECRRAGELNAAVGAKFVSTVRTPMV